MYLVSVIPLSATLSTEKLSYFSKESLEKGTLVKIPLRRQSKFALVTDTTDVKNVKSTLRTSHFGLKKIEEVVAPRFFTQAFLSAAEEIANSHTLSLGQVLDAFTPKDLFRFAQELKGQIQKTKNPSPLPKAKKQVVQSTFLKRMETYHTYAEETSQRGFSTHLLVPDIGTGEKVKRFFEERTGSIFFFHSSLSKKTWENELHTLIQSKGPIVIISTPAFLSLPRSDIGLVILEDENKETYRRMKRPYLDARVFAESFADAAGASFILGASLIRTETSVKEEALKRSSDFEKNISRPQGTHLIDMKKYRKDEKGFQIFSEKTFRELKKSMESNQKIFLFSVRKGVAGITLCRDCGTILFCPSCTTPLTLENTRQGRMFVCRKCGLRESAKKRENMLCAHCHGFRLEAFGIGTEKIREEVEKIFPEVPIFQIDGSTTKTHQQARKMAEKWRNENEGAILIGTEMSLKYLERSADLSLIVSLDSLFAIPDFRINSKIFSILCEVAENTRKSLFIQTRNPESPLLSVFLKEDKEAFHKTDKEERKKFDFPPFVKFIKITGALRSENEKTQQKKIEKFFESYHPLVYPGFIDRVKNRDVIHTLLVFKEKEVLSEDLKKRLLALPPHYEIRIDPESIL